MRIGITGNGMIVRRMLQDIKGISEIELSAICVRAKSLEKGRDLAEEFGIPAVDTDYRTFLEREDMDTVYIGIVNQMHYEYAKKALEAGKHVICEKPFTVTACEAKELEALADEKGLFLWEAFKIPYSPVFQAVKRYLGEIGAVKMVQCNYSRISSRYRQYEQGIVLPAFDPACSGGCLYDINLYNLHFVTGLFGRPEEVDYYANLGFNGVDTSGTAVLKYGNFLGICSGAKDSSSPCGALIQGTKGWIRIEGPVSSAARAEITVDGEQRLLAEDPAPGTLTGEMAEFAGQLHRKDWSSCREMMKHTVMMMEILENAAGQRGSLSAEACLTGEGKE